MSFYARWILANGWAEGLGLGATFVIAGFVAPLLNAEPSRAAILAGAAGAVVLGTVLEGALVGIAQERVLRSRLSAVPRGGWILATAAGAGLAWLLGMIPSTAMALGGMGVEEPPAAEPSRLVQYLLAILIGLATGPILGLAQWTVLRRYVSDAGRWLWANALAWAAGMPTVFVGMDLMPWGGNRILLAASIILLCGLTGLIVGAVHGRILAVLTEGAVACSQPGSLT